MFEISQSSGTTLTLHYSSGSEETGHIWDYTAWISLEDIARNYRTDSVTTIWLEQLASDSAGELHHELNGDDLPRSVLKNVVVCNYVVKKIVRMKISEIE